jgi:putative transposase
MVDIRRLPVGERDDESDELATTLDELAREGARRMILAALRAEVEEYVERFADEVDEDGRRLVVRNGRARERRVTVGSGTLAVRAPRVNDKRVDEETGERERFGSRILPAYVRRSPKVGELLPILYLRGLSTGDFRPALEGLLGEDASGLSPATISRLCKEWEGQRERFRKRLLSSRYCYLFVDGVHVSVRLGEDDRLCLLVVIGVREDGTKELLAVEDGYRESSDSWSAVMRDLKRRGLNEPKLVVGDGALGIWGALRDVFPGAGEQRCWVHKTANVLDCLPKRLQPRAKGMLHEIVEAPTRADARQALECLREEFGAKYPKALEKLDKDWKPLTAFYDFPAEHWGPPTHDEPNREQLRNRQAPHAGDQGRRVEGRCAGDGLHAVDHRPGALAAVQRPRAGRRGARRSDVQGRCQGHRRRNHDAGREGRRLMTVTLSSTTFDNKGPPSQCSRLKACLVIRRGRGLTIRARTPRCGRGSRPMLPVLTIWTGCDGRMGFAARCVGGRRRGSCRTGGGRAGSAGGGCRPRRGRSFTARGRR